MLTEIIKKREQEKLKNKWQVENSEIKSTKASQEIVKIIVNDLADIIRKNVC